MKKIFSIILMLALLAFGAAALAEDYIYISYNANVRTGPGLGYSSIGSLNGNSTVAYAHESAYDSRGVCWYKVWFGEGAGWVSSSYAWPTNEPGAVEYGGGGNIAGMFWHAGSVVLAEGDVNVRTGPGLGFAIVDTMLTGETADYLGVSSSDERGVTWFNVQFDGNEGWVSSTWASLTGEQSDYGSVKGTGGDSNVRTGPGLGYSTIGCLYKGESADYLGASSVDERGVAWYNISFDGQSGWVSSKYTALQ